MTGGGVVVVTGEGVVVEADIIYNYFINTMIHFPTHDSPVTSVVTVASPVTTAKKPLAVLNALVKNLTVMVVPVIVPGVEYAQKRWVEVPSLTSTQSVILPSVGQLSVPPSYLYKSNAANVNVAGSPVVDSTLHS